MGPSRRSPNVGTADPSQMSSADLMTANMEKHLRAPTGRSAAGLEAVPWAGSREGSNSTERAPRRKSIRAVPTCTFAAGSVASAAPGRQLPESKVEARRKKLSKDGMQTQPANRISQVRVESTTNAESTPSNVKAQSMLARSSQIFSIGGPGQRQRSATTQSPPSTSDRQPTSTGKEQTPHQPPASGASGSQLPSTSDRRPLHIDEDKGQSETSTDPLRQELSGELARVSLRAGPSKGHPEIGIRTINLGIETEFYLASRDTDYFGEDMTNFVAFLTHSYNLNVTQQHPRMRPGFRPYGFKGDYDKWCMVLDRTMNTPHSPWGLELVSPVFKAFPLSTWRKDVEATWKFLQRYYNILGSELCGTHIHISIEPKNTLHDLKRIAQAAIHFETALEALMPPDRRGNEYAKSNWLDDPNFGHKGLTRRECIAAIERVSHLSGLVDLMQPFLFGTDRDYAWNFHSVRFPPNTIEFRKPPVSLTPDAALSWAELVLSFVHASVRCNSSQLQKVPPTVGGLRWFLHQFHVPGMNEPARLERLWRGKDPKAAVEPIPRPEGTDEEIEDISARLGVLAAADKRRIQAFANATQEPYW